MSNFFYGDFQFETLEEFLLDFGMNQLYSFALSFSNIGFFYGLSKIEWKDNQWLLRFTVGVLGSVVVSFISLLLLRYIPKYYNNELSFVTFIAKENWRYYSFGLWIALTVVVTFHVFYLYKKRQERKVTESQIVAKTETAKYESLKSQLDPHFLFNSLNVLTSLIEESPKKAEKFTTGLSKVYRYVLE